jgi:four helix bundle protein
MGKAEPGGPGRYGPGAGAFGFEDLEVYKAAQRFRRRAYAFVAALPADERFALAQQIRRAAASLTANIAEGYGRHHWQEGIQYCRQSRGSLLELVDALGLCQDAGYVQPAEVEAARQEALETLRLLNGYIGYLRKKKAE